MRSYELDFYKPDSDVVPEDLPVAPVGIHGLMESQSWRVGAFDRVIDNKSSLNFEDAYGIIAIRDVDVAPEAILKVAEYWVKTSKANAWTSGLEPGSFFDPTKIWGRMLAGEDGSSRRASIFEDERATVVRWLGKTFLQAEEETGTSTRWGQPDVPVGTHFGVSYVPAGPDYYVANTRNVGLSPLDQFSEFLNKQGDSVKDWKVVDETTPSRLSVMCKMEIEEVTVNLDQ